jgi:hypothetical protein
MANERSDNVIRFRKPGQHRQARPPLGVLGAAFWGVMILGNIAFWIWLGAFAIKILSKFRS